MKKLTKKITTLIFFCIACNTTTELQTNSSIIVEKREKYNASNTRKVDLVHTDLSVMFDWEKQHVLGEARLILKPYFHAINSLQIDAKGFDIHNISLIENNKKTDLNFKYDNKKIDISFPETYTKNEEINLFIKYTAKPNELANSTGLPISGDKGLYFINPLGEEKNKPQQIWTQGETEYNSCWFPTIDSPNESMTQELAITVQEKFTTLSNGELIFKKNNNDGTRTDYWKQNLPHTPYLTMLAIGEFDIIDDSKEDLLINYYIEKDYASFAKEIFGTTPEMIDFFESKLGVKYPWDKYSQIVVRDFVSGAMENTGAVIYGEFLHQTTREMIDGNNEDIIAHELIHHWFGNLVTCESWANLPLNESFATYGEYLWAEYKHGKNKADLILQNFANEYFEEAQYTSKDLIRFDYSDKEEMFDSHSYSKGACVLHMLRNHIGDEAFFASLQLYLNKNKHQPVEIHNLRLAFEKITGEDLNWFFNQWFLNSGHPSLKIQHKYDSDIKKLTLEVTQEQDTETAPLYILPITLEVHANNIKEFEILVDKKKQTFSFDIEEAPMWVNFDKKKMLLTKKTEYKEAKEWAYQFTHANTYIDKYESLEALTLTKDKNLFVSIIKKGLSDSFWKIRWLALDKVFSLDKEDAMELKPLVLDLAIGDSSSEVKAHAIYTLAAFFESKEWEVYLAAIKDSSYSVAAEGLYAITMLSPEEALPFAKELAKNAKGDLLFAIMEIYSLYGKTETENRFFKHCLHSISNYDLPEATTLYTNFLINQKPVFKEENINFIVEIAVKGEPWWQRLVAIQNLVRIKEKMKENNEKTNKIEEILEEILAQEKSQQVLMLLYSIID